MGKQAWIVLAVLVVLAGCGISTVPLYERHQLERDGWTPEEINSLQQERAVKEISDGLNGIHFTTPGHYYLQAQQFNDPPRKCHVCLGHGYCRGAIGVMGQCYACGGTGLTP